MEAGWIVYEAKQIPVTADSLVGASLSEPHTSVTALLDACVCLRVAIYRKFKLSERISNLHTC